MGRALLLTKIHFCLNIRSDTTHKRNVHVWVSVYLSWFSMHYKIARTELVSHTQLDLWKSVALVMSNTTEAV